MSAGPLTPSGPRSRTGIDLGRFYALIAHQMLDGVDVLLDLRRCLASFHVFPQWPRPYE